MKQKQSKVIYTPNKSFECKIPLGWDGIAKKLNIAVNRYNQHKQRKWEESSLIHRLFFRPAKYKVEIQASGVPEMMKLYPETNHHRIWIESTREKRMHFDLLCRKESVANSMFLQNGVKYNHFLLMGKDSSPRWTDKKYKFLYEFIPFINPEVS